MTTEAEDELVRVDPGTPTTVSVPRSAYGALLRPIHAVGWRNLRLAGFACYAAVLVWVLATFGVPTARPALAVIIVSGLLLTSIGQGWRRSGQVLIDWLPFTAVLMAYDQTRGIADSLGIPLHEHDIVRAEGWVFGGSNPTVWLQHHLYQATQVHWYDALCTIVYTSHFLATPILAAILWVRDRALWMRYITRVVLLSVAGLVTYILFPEAPPWMASRDGYLGAVHRLSPRGWAYFDADNVSHALAHAQQDPGANAVAAMPSLHTALAVLVAIFVATRIRSRWRYLLALYPLAMAFTLVYCGEHYVLDVVAGAGYAFATHWAVSWWEARRARMRAVALS